MGGPPAEAWAASLILDRGDGIRLTQTVDSQGSVVPPRSAVNSGHAPRINKGGAWFSQPNGQHTSPGATASSHVCMYVSLRAACRTHRGVGCHSHSHLRLLHHSPSSERFAVVHASSVISRRPAYSDTAPKSLSCNSSTCERRGVIHFQKSTPILSQYVL